MADYSEPNPYWATIEGPNIEEYDTWGYKPQGLKWPTQWASFFGPLNPKAASFPAPEGWAPNPLWFPDAILRNWGGPPGTSGPGRVDEYAKKVVKERLPYSGFISGNPKLCNPENFPDCDMTPMQVAAPQLLMWDDQIYEPFNAYRKAVDDVYTNGFVNGGIEAWDDVNQDDTSGYDPCNNPTLIEILLPLILAGGSAFLMKKYGVPPLMDAGLPADVGDVLVIGSLVFGWNISRGILTGEGDQSIYYDNAAKALLYPAAFIGGTYLGDYAFQNTTVQITEEQFEIIGGVGLVWLASPLQKTVTNVLILGLGPVKLIIGLVNGLLGGVVSFFCKAVTGNYDSCEDKTTFATGRRWDVPSVAGMLTREVMEREGWQADDPRTEFVFRGLVTGPGMMDITSNSGKTIFDNVGVNPLGQIYQLPWYINGDTNQNVFTYDAANSFGWDGDVSGVMDTANHNLFACQKWEVMRYGDQEPASFSSQDVARKFDDWIGNWEKDTDGSLTKAAHDPAKVQAMHHIRGWAGMGTEPLTNCQKAVEAVLQAGTTKARQQLAEQNYASNTDCTPEEDQWLEDNSDFFKWVNGWEQYPNPGQIWTYISTKLWKSATPQQLSAALYAITAMPPGEIPPDFNKMHWAKMDHRMWKAMLAYPPPKGLPYRDWGEPPRNPLSMLLQTVNEWEDWKSAVLDAPDFGARSTNALAFGGTLSDEQELWLHVNAIAYRAMVTDAQSKRLLSANLDSILGSVITSDPQKLSDALWAMRAVPRNAAQKKEFDAYWRTGEVFDNLIPQLPKPADYPYADVLVELKLPTEGMLPWLTENAWEGWRDAVLGAADLGGRSTAAHEFNGNLTADQNLWIEMNAKVYYAAVTNEQNKKLLAENLEEVVGSAVYNDPQQLSKALWAVRAVPLNRAQDYEFNTFWDGDPIPALIPQYPKPADYPPANVTQGKSPPTTTPPIDLLQPILNLLRPILNLQPRPIGLLPGQPISDPGNCQALKHDALGAPSLQARGLVCADYPKIGCDDPVMTTFYAINDVVYGHWYQSGYTANDLEAAWPALMSGTFGKNEFAVWNDALFAILVPPTNSAQMAEFHALWGNGVPNNLQPKGPEPPQYSE